MQIILHFSTIFGYFLTTIAQKKRPPKGDRLITIFWQRLLRSLHIVVDLCVLL